MDALLITFVLAFLCTMGARDQIVLVQISAAGQRRVAWLAVAIVTAGATTALAAWVGAEAGALVTAQGWPVARGLALALAGARLLPVARIRPLREPTRSIGAAAIVLCLLQIGDAARWAILAIGLFGAAVPTACGGVLGSAAALAIGWRYGDRLLSTFPQLCRARQVLGVILIEAAAVLTAAGLFDRI